MRNILLIAKREYLEQLNRHYESWIKNYTLGPLLVIESDGLDFVHDDKDFHYVEKLVEEKLAKQ